MIDITFIRPYIEQLYEGLATIKYRPIVRDTVTGITRQGDEIILVEDEPCRVSQKSEPVSTERDFPAATETVMLFIAPELQIPAGSHVIVTQHGETREYATSGYPAVFCTHQEINLELWSKAI